ncbi:unnamed protein product [Chironomus riparius]|uniref:FAD synthase n=1 Tax=Chironomus riparius TaxID=315576 RepID=A0A9N9RKX9_9DIPT|nr:unnamed protein product [Chironomus riparius]
MSNQLDEKIEKSLDILKETFQNYQSNQIFLSFNGGKDCTVLLDLLLKRCYINESDKLGIKIIYMRQVDPFDEIESFVKECESYYKIEIKEIEISSMKIALAEICKNDPELQAVLMGCRKSDPTYKNRDELHYFEPTDGDWPKLMRVNPLLDWSCKDIWDYIISHNVPYCDLYNNGFTSVGNRKNTVPNPHLLNDDKKTYRPAFELTDDTLERAGRL